MTDHNKRLGKPFLLALVGVVFSITLEPAWAEREIRHNYAAGNPKEELALDILKLALESAPGNETYSFRSVPEFLSEGRLMQTLEDGDIDVAWAGTQQEYEERLRPIRVPIFKGMLGHRIFIIRQGDQARFNQVQSLDDLRQIPGGQGRFWGDTKILQHSNLNIITTSKYENLFPMLEGGRFDYFPRAVHEPWSEVESRPELNLTIEKRILLIYPLPMYFFVEKGDEALARAIEQGLRNSIEDGSFDEFFFNRPIIKNALEQANLSERLVLRIPNPNLSPQTPLEEKQLWLDIADL